MGRYLVNAENYAAVKRTYRLATEVADNFSDEVYSLRVLGDALIRYGQSDRERAEGEEAFEAAMNIGTRYPDLARNIDEISYTNLLTQLAWLSTWSGFDCRRASFNLEQADKFSQTTGT